MEVSETIPSSHSSAVSPDGAYIATALELRLDIRQVSTLNIIRTVNIPISGQSRFLCIRWSPAVKGVGASQRFLYSDEDKTYVWDMQDAAWSATIDNGTGGMGKIVNVEFGHDESEILVFSGFGSKVTVWSLWTGKNVEIRDPKFARRGYGRGGTGRSSRFALLTRPGAQDVVQLHIPVSYAQIKSFTPPTVDAQGLNWSSDGRWLAIWDTPSTGYKVLIYTADGNLFRIYTGDYFEDELRGLGVKRLEWSPNGDFLAIAGFESTISLLGTRTFSPAVRLSHLNTIKPTRTQLWQEVVSSSDRSYTRATQPLSPPGPPIFTDDAWSKIGISILSFSADGTYLATKDDSKPSTCYIWDLSQLICCAVLVQHSVIKGLTWHPTDPNTLLIQCVQGDAIIYTWNALEAGPRIFSMPSVTFSGKAEAQWVPKAPHRKTTIMFGDMHGYALAYPEGRDEGESPVAEGQSQQREHPTADSDDDSLYEILSARKAATVQDQTPYSATEDLGIYNGAPEDTFLYRKGVVIR